MQFLPWHLSSAHLAFFLSFEPYFLKTIIQNLTGWGRYPVHSCRTFCPQNENELKAIVAMQQKSASTLIARGNGRSYGDAGLNSNCTIEMRSFNRMVSFDDQSGTLVVEAGVLLSDIIDVFLPRGWFPAITPGTKLVTIGGMIAADVHGKNHHHVGSFGSCLEWFEILGSDGSKMTCSREENIELFNQTIGGMGLTGIILRASLRLIPVQSGWIEQKKIVANNLIETMQTFDKWESSTYSVAWIDCLAKGDALGRSVLFVGEHSSAEQALRSEKRRYPVKRKVGLTVPFNLPTWCLNKYTIKCFNTLYYWVNRLSVSTSLVHWDKYFYPLDSIGEWNRLYGKRGFMQFQCVLPVDHSIEGMTALLNRISSSGAGSFLAVLKKLGEQGTGISFPMTGYTLALDFPVSQENIALVDELNEITCEFGGRVYLAKDSRLSPSQLATLEPRAEAFNTLRESTSAGLLFQSSQSQRLGL